MKRVAYDADTQRYTFQDHFTGTLYRSEPGNVYGTLTPVSCDDNNVHGARPNAFASTGEYHGDPIRRHIELAPRMTPIPTTLHLGAPSEVCTKVLVPIRLFTSIRLRPKLLKFMQSPRVIGMPALHSLSSQLNLLTQSNRSCQGTGKAVCQFKRELIRRVSSFLSHHLPTNVTPKIRPQPHI
jgi:hypothetical protein